MAILKSESIEERGGIPRAVEELISHWNPTLDLSFVTPVTFSWPLLRNYPFSIRMREHPALLYLPKTGGSTVLRHRHIPSVVTVHDVGFWDCREDRMAPGPQQFMIYPHFYARRYAYRIVTVSEFTKSRLTAMMPVLSERIVVIPWGISRTFIEWRRSPRESRDLIEQCLRRPLSHPLIIYVGDDSLRKNLSLLLTVFRGVKSVFPQAQLFKVGSARRQQDRGRTLDELERLQLRPNDDVLFFETIDDDMLAALYCAADIFVSASLYEGFGLPPLEALAVGTPAVVTNRAAFPEVVGSVARLVTPTAPTMVRGVVEVLKSPPRAAVKEFIRSYVREKYSWDRTAHAYLHLFSTMVRH